VGDARLALDALLGKRHLPTDVLARARARLETPTPRVALGMALRGVATSAIDISDGLLGDLAHVLQQSHAGATVNPDIAIESIASYAHSTCATSPFDLNLSLHEWRTLALAGGDDYELLFTAAPAQRSAVANAAQLSQTPVRRIGQIEAQAGLRLVDNAGQAVANTFASYDHFA
jgi:thiamine-monophosphate kinase